MRNAAANLVPGLVPGIEEVARLRRRGQAPEEARPGVRQRSPHPRGRGGRQGRPEAAAGESGGGEGGGVPQGAASVGLTKFR